MTRRDLLKAPALAAGRLGERPPNILWVCSDQQRFDTIEGLNNSHVRTPNLRRFMNEAVTFTNAYVQSPVCSPSRASFLTGRYPRTTGLCMNGQSIRPTERLVPRILADMGYTCGLSGKLHLSPVSGGRVEQRIDDGYSHFWWSHDIANQWPGRNEWLNWLAAQGQKWPQRIGDPGGVALAPKYMQTDWCAEKAIGFLRQQKGYGPWMMSVNIYQPHQPFQPAVEILERYEAEKMPAPSYRAGELETKPAYQRAAQGNPAFPFERMSELERRRVTAAYYAMVEQVDLSFGRMVSALEESGQAENTIVIYMSDHGEMLGDHGFYLKGPHFYDPAIRVPLLIRWPKRYRAGLRSEALVELADLAPTLLEAVGAPVPEGMQGRSLTGLLTGEEKAHRDSIYCEYYALNRRGVAPVTSTCVRTEKAKIVVHHALKSGELYDLERDAGEFENLWAAAGARGLKEQMMERVVERMAGTVDALPLRTGPW